MTDNRALQTPGERLSGLRLAAGRSLDELAEATKIPPPMLLAIEQDEYHKISGDLYVKSFLRAYASEMGVEAEEILNLYGNFTGAITAPVAEDGAPVWQEEEVQIKRLGLPWVTIALVVGAVLLVLGGGFFAVKILDNPEETPAEVPETTEQAPDSTRHAVTEPEAFKESLLSASSLGQQKQPETATPAAAEKTPAVVKKIAPEKPDAVEGKPEQLKIEGRTWPVVLRLLCPGPRGASVKKDGDRTFSQVDWPATQRNLPSDAIRAGHAYHVREGMAIYWGAEDHFSLKLDDPADCHATINGQFRDISGMGPGEEVILNDPAVIRSNLPSARSADRP